MARAALALPLLGALAAAAPRGGAVGVPTPVPLDSATISINGVLPYLAHSANADDANRSECGHGALLAWADKLWVITYLSVPNAGSGTGLYAIDANMQQTLVAPHNSTYANRMLHPPTQQAVIGPFVIDRAGNVRTIEALMHVRIGGMARHLTQPDTHVYMLGMDGPLWEVDLVTLEAKQLWDLVTALDIPASEGEQPHFKAAYTMGGRVYVASNTFEQNDYLGLQHGGRLASWDGDMATNWTIIERTAFVEITGRNNFGCTIFALGFDDLSVILKVIDVGCDDKSYDPAIQTYRLPRASHAYDHLWTTEWPRIREVESERFLMDMHGMFYELTPFTWGGAAWGIKPISQHLRMVPDFASWRGFLVLGGNQVSSIFDNNLVTGQSQSGLWFGTTDDLWSHGGKPAGWGGPWRYTPAPGGVPSDPFLMTGFVNKVAHLRAEAAGTAPGVTTVQVAVQIDFTGAAGHAGASMVMEPWSTLTTVDVPVGGYAFYAFPAGFSAHWVRFVPSVDCNCTAQLTYT